MKIAVLLLAAFSAMLLSACGSSGKHFVYVVGESTEGIFGFSEAGDGALTSISGSPFSIGGIPRAIAITPSRAFAYVLSQGGSAVVGYTFDKSKGGLVTATAPVLTGGAPIDAASQHLYVLSQASSNISAFSIDSTSGALTAVSGSPYATLTNPTSMAMSPKGSALYVTSPTQGIGAVPINADGSLGSAQAALVAGTSPTFVAVDPSGALVYVADGSGNAVHLFTASGASLTATTISSQVGTTPSALTVDPKGKFVFVANEGSNNVSVFTIGSGGALSQVQGSPFATGTSPVFVVTDHSGNVLYVADHESSDIAEFSIAGNGALATISGSPIPVPTTAVYIEAE
jgi:6-phosphogluconolactonase (cycloisomerase 2 family)